MPNARATSAVYEDRHRREASVVLAAAAGGLTADSLITRLRVTPMRPLGPRVSVLVSPPALPAGAWEQPPGQK